MLSLLATSSPTLGERFLQVITDPAALELLILIVFTLLLLFTFRRMGRVAQELAKRRELREYVRGLTRLMNGEYSAAVKDLTRVVDRDPEHAEARIALGDAYHALGDGAEAHRHHYHVQEVYGQASPRVSLSLGRDLLLLDRKEEAVEHFTAALNGEVEKRPARELLVETLAALGREEEAIPLVKGPAELTNPQIGRLHAAAGFRALTRGHEREGVKHLQRALDLNPGLLAPRMALVGRRWVHGDASGAWQAFRSHLNKVHLLAREGGVLETGAPPEGLQRVFERSAESTGSRSDPEALPAGDRATPVLPEHGDAAGNDDAADDADAADAAVSSERRGAVSRQRAADVLELGGGQEALGLQAKDLGAMVETVVEHRAQYRCVHCGGAQPSFESHCHECGQFSGLRPIRAAAVRSGREIAEVIDEIEENRYHIGRLVEQLVAGDAAAEGKLLRLGPKAIPEIFQRMMEVTDNRPLVAFLKKLGPDYLDLIGNAYLHMRTFGSRNILREGLAIFRSFDRVMEEILSTMGEGAVPYLRQYMAHPDEALRVIALKTLVRVGGGVELEEVSEIVPRAEMVTRLNESEAAPLLRLIRTMDPGGYLAREVLPDRTFQREEILIRSLDDPEAIDTVFGVIQRRGFSPVLFDGLVRRLKGATRDAAVQLLAGFLPEAHDHLVRVFTRPGLDVHCRVEVERLLARDAARTAERIVQELPLPNAELMAGVLSLFGRLGVPALEIVEKRYGRGGRFQLLGLDIKFGFSRDKAVQLKADLLRLVGAVGGDEAIELLIKLEGDESDAELRELARRLRKNVREGRR